MISTFIADCKNYSDVSFIRAHLDRFPPALTPIVNDPNGEQVLETGAGLFTYLADLVAKGGDESLRAWLIPLLGYPDHEHTDLFSPFFDVWRTRLLWNNAVNHLDAPTPEIKAELVLNVYFRWYICAIELMRKALTFALYCRQRQLGISEDSSFKRCLYRGADPIKPLSQLDTTSNVETITQFYTKTLRHALAHGNVIIAIPERIAVRQTSETSSSPGHKEERRSLFVEDVYSLGPGTNDQDIQRIVTTFQEHADPCFQSVRVFFILYSSLQSRYSELIGPQWPTNYNNKTLGALNKVISEDPEGLRYWQKPSVQGSHSTSPG